MHRILLALALIVLIATGALVGWSSFGTADSVAVDTVMPQRRSLASTLELTGTVINDRTVTITALLDGEIVAIGAREGDTVAKGAMLATLDNRYAATELDKARAELELARRRLAGAERERERTLATRSNLPGRAMDDAEDAFADATLETRVAEASVRLVELRIENATVSAPFAGTLTDRTAETGQWIEAGTKLFTLVADDGDVIEARVDAGDAARVVLDAPVTLSSDAWPERTWTSAVTWISPDVTRDDGGANRFAVRVPPGDAAPPLKLGERVDVMLEIDRVNEALVLGLDALDEHAPGSYRALIIENGTARAVDVEVGLVTVEQAQITDGIGDGARIITPAGSVEPGTAVTPRDRGPDTNSDSP